MKRIQKNQIYTKVGLNKLAFTLVELIVVITILAILGTIAFISLQGYSSQARDSKRLSDISNIKKSLELFSLNTGKYPLPDEYFTVSYSGEELWHQGIVGDQVTTNLSKNLNKKPIDPSSELEYTYSTTHSQTEYEVLGLYESDILSQIKLLGNTNAETQDYVKIDGNYNGIYIKTSSLYVPTPSIINAEIVLNDDLDNTLIKSQVITGGDNLPGVLTGGLNITLSVYEGTITEKSTDEEKIALVEVIQAAYSGSDLVNNTAYADILSRTSTGEMLDFIHIVVLNNDNYSNLSINNDEIYEDETSTYSFSSFTFTNCGQTGRTGPTLSMCRSSYDTDWDEDDLLYNMTTQGIQEWTVPVSGNYRIEAYGAKGGNFTIKNTIGGFGAIIIGDFTLESGDKLKILVGQAGDNSVGSDLSNYCGGGGGGTFITDNTNSPIIIAGGGGGAGRNTAARGVGQITTNGQDGSNTYGGQNGNGGISRTASYGGAGGGGLLTGSETSNQAFILGGLGGEKLRDDAGNGGFGGGGGGGGYSGGGASSNGGFSAGGGSYNSGTNQSNISGTNSGVGKVIITFLD